MNENPQARSNAEGNIITPSYRGRRIFSGVLLIIGLILLLVAIPVLWMNRTILTTDGWVEAVGPLAEDPAVQVAVANVAAQQFIEQANIQEWIRQQLPPESAGFAAPLTVLFESAIRQLTNVLVSSDLFASLWSDANRVSHSLALAGYERGQDFLENQNGNIVIDLGSIVQQIQEQLASLGISVPLPENFSSQVTVFQSEQLPAFLNFVNTLDALIPWLTILAVLFLAASIAVPTDRRRAVLFLGIGVAVVGVVLFIIGAIVKWRVVGQVPADAVFPPVAVNQAYDTITGGLTTSLRALILIGLLLWLGAYILGPSNSMVATRHRVRHWIHGLSPNRNPAASELWIGAHRQALQVIILIAAGIVLVIPSQRTVPFVLILTAIVVLLEFLVEYLGRTPPAAVQR